MNVYLYKRNKDGQLVQLWYDRGCRSWYGNESFSVSENSRIHIERGTAALLRRWVRIGWLELRDEDFEVEVEKPAKIEESRCIDARTSSSLFDVKRSECLGVLTREEVVRQ